MSETKPKGIFVSAERASAMVEIEYGLTMLTIAGEAVDAAEAALEAAEERFALAEERVNEGMTQLCAQLGKGQYP
jgi:outer membrane protein TolC